MHADKAEFFPAGASVGGGAGRSVVSFSSSATLYVHPRPTEHIGNNAVIRTKGRRHSLKNGGVQTRNTPFPCPFTIIHRRHSIWALTRRKREQATRQLEVGRGSQNCGYK